MKDYHLPDYESCHSSDSESDNTISSKVKASSSSQSIDEQFPNEHKDPVKKRRRRKSSHNKKSHNNIVPESTRHNASMEHSCACFSISTNSSNTHAEQQQETTLLKNHLKTYYQEQAKIKYLFYDLPATSISQAPRLALILNKEHKDNEYSHLSQTDDKNIYREELLASFKFFQKLLFGTIYLPRMLLPKRPTCDYISSVRILLFINKRYF